MWQYLTAKTSKSLATPWNQAPHHYYYNKWIRIHHEYFPLRTTNLYIHVLQNNACVSAMDVILWLILCNVTFTGPWPPMAITGGQYRTCTCLWYYLWIMWILLNWGIAPTHYMYSICHLMHKSKAGRTASVTIFKVLYGSLVDRHTPGPNHMDTFCALLCIMGARFLPILHMVFIKFTLTCTIIRLPQW